MLEKLSYKQHFGKTINLAYPVMLSQVGHVTVGIVDSIMVGQIGTEALAASSFANNVMMVFLMFGIGMSYGITPLVAQADGEGDRNKIMRLLRHGIVLCLGTSLVLVLSGYLLSFGFGSFSQPEEVIRLGKPYFYVILFSMIPMMLFQNFRQFAEGLSITKPTMFITIGANLINVLFNYLLIYGKFGFPELGLIGAGWGTLISRIFMAAGMILYVGKSQRTKYYREAFKIFNITAAYFKPMLKIGVPSGTQFVFEVSAFAGAALLMGKMGVVPLAAHQIALSLVSLSYMMATGIAAASTVRIGNQVGRRDAFNLNRAGNTSFMMALIFMACCSVVYIVFHNFFPTLYIDDPEVIRIAGSLIIVAGFFQLSDGVQVVGLGSLRGMSDVRVPTVITFVAYWVLGIPVSYLFGFVLGFGPEGVWYGLLTGLSIAAITLFIRFKVLAKRKALSFGTKDK
ncbi:MATE family efflux transporter [Roseivirga sp.]|uniref:MATE family efflux transporter n=1 Tax=Roseivirga sp. TaxID=1964215 RepID=UPI002B268842|nr:MATE family efflux transporter [Roseivirga sp.]